MTSPAVRMGKLGVCLYAGQHHPVNVAAKFYKGGVGQLQVNVLTLQQA